MEIALAGRELGEAFEELEARLAERPGFYRGSSAAATFGDTLPTPDELARLRALLSQAGVELRRVTGIPAIEPVARAGGLEFEANAAPASPAHELDRRRALRPPRELKLSDAARSLVADFAGARADIADRRQRGEASVPRLDLPKAVPEPAPALHLVAAPPSTLYHPGTLRGGQALHHDGNIVVIGDVNPGAELIASGDVLVFGRLAGVAHAGAEGDAEARVYALELVATQLRIATFIATEAPESRPASRDGSVRAEAALVRDGRIAVVAFDQLGKLERGVPSL
ncbi:MAG TPA: septum site-determining protein MinC [Candidatus Tumulicola sp.]